FGPDGKVKWQLNGSSNSTHNYLTACAVSQSQALVSAGYTSPAWWMFRQNETGAQLSSTTWHPGEHGAAYGGVREDGTGFVVSGYMFHAGLYRALGLKTDGSGNAWQSFWADGGTNEFAYDGIAHPFGGYWLAGGTQTKGSIYYDGILYRFSATAAYIGKTIVGGGAEDRFFALALLPKGGLVVGGITGSKGAGNADGWLVFFGDDGKVTREVTYGGPGNDIVRSLVATSDGGYTLAGWTASGSAQGNDGWVVHTDSFGNAMWQKTYGGAKDDQFQSVRTTPEGGLVLAGTSDSQFTALQAWVLRTDPWGNTSCSEAGACAGLRLEDCGDGNPCTADWCHQVAGCMHKALADGAVCAGAGNTCKGGVCQGL
ncbi:MAG: hypothetical protein FJ100_21430, partial [Deltaproteobacteria bacterium]|nr:hypothetical protein [Deltaproteobacteria bacterium]